MQVHSSKEKNVYHLFISGSLDKIGIKNNQIHIKKEEKNKINPVNLWDIERIDVI